MQRKTATARPVRPARRDREGLAEADAGEFATAAEVEAAFEKWQRTKGDAD
jgi:predicted transcriptional regulator